MEDSACPRTSCARSTQVWRLTSDYVAIRDLKACGCPADFVHGLALPLAPVTGLDDGHRPDGIWEFAWRTAEERIDDPHAIALIVNPPVWRSQDQLHVHILRLRMGARDRLIERSTRLPTLNAVWSSAAKIARNRSIEDNYGVLIARATDGGYLLVVDDGPLETIYGQGRCRSPLRN